MTVEPGPSTRSPALRPPTPRPAVASADLVRPDWTTGGARDPSRLWLDKNENFDPALAAVITGVAESLPAAVHSSYPDLGPLYRKLGAYLGLAPSRLLLSAGSDGAIRAAFEAFVSPGDVVIHPNPTFAMYPVYCRIYGARAVGIDYLPGETGPVFQPERMLEAIAGTAPRLVCLPNPDSPTGTVVEPDTLRAIVEAAGRAGALMLVDEAYFPFHPWTCLNWVEEYPHLLVTRSTGKAWGLAGFRIGYAAASPGVAALLHKVRAMYEVGTVPAAVFERMLDHADAMEASVARLLAGKAAFLAAMGRLGFPTHAGYGNFMHVAFGARAPEIHEALENVAYYRRGFTEPALAGYSRFSATTPDLFGRVIGRIEATCAI